MKANMNGKLVISEMICAGWNDKTDTAQLPPSGKSEKNLT